MKTDAEILDALDSGAIYIQDLWHPFQTGPKPGFWHWYDKAEHKGFTPADSFREAASRLIEARETSERIQARFSVDG